MIFSAVSGQIDLKFGGDLEENIKILVKKCLEEKSSVLTPEV
jgi:hypothetical protein